MPVVNGVRQCPCGDYTDIRDFGDACSFGDSCRFGDACSFGARCSFGVWCRFGDACRFENGRTAKAGHPLICISGVGSAYRTTYFFNTESGIFVRSGCFSGTLTEFRAKVLEDTRGDKTCVKALQYLGVANIVAATWAPEQIELHILQSDTKGAA